METNKYIVSLVWANDNHTQNSIYTKSSEHAYTVLGNALGENKHFMSDYKLVSFIVLNVDNGNVVLKSKDIMNKTKITKREEAQQDLQRYYKILPTCDKYEVREFFYNGIISLDTTLDRKLNEWELYQMIEDCYYNYAEMASWCCVEREDFHDVLKGDFPDRKTLKKMYIGLKTYGQAD